MKFNKTFLILLFAVAGFSLNAQIMEDFSDGNLDNNPNWQGDLSDFKINASQELQLDASQAGSSFLYTATSFPDSLVWEFYTRLEFAPSNSNSMDFYLQLDNSDISIANGYGIHIGATGAEDALEFFRLDAGVPSAITSGQLGAVADNPMVRLKINKDPNGSWKLAVDYSGGLNPQPELAFLDNEHSISQGFLGLACTYTSSRTNAFYFDDIVMKEETPDNIPPQLLSVEVLSNFELKLEFNEPLDKGTAENQNNYELNNGLGNPSDAFLSALNTGEVRLQFPVQFTNQTTYELEVSNISDTTGNLLNYQSISFDYIEISTANSYDLVLNEIMADPSPSLGLPESEYIEIYNRSNSIFEASDLSISDNSNLRFLNSGLIYPGDYIIVCAPEHKADFEVYGKVITQADFPALNNNGDLIQLKNSTGDLIHDADYNLNWYGTSTKADGGYSLELINPQSPCLLETNWIASDNLNGGTPGRENSVLNAVPDDSFLDLLIAFPQSENELLLTFNKRIDPSTFDASSFLISPDIEINDFNTLGLSPNQILIRTAEDFELGKVYIITVTGDVADCQGNQIGMINSKEFALPDKAEPGDVIINEILFNPYPNGFDFVELYNKSGKVFNIKDFKIGNIDEFDSKIINMDVDRLFFPGEYLTISSYVTNILENYTVLNPDQLVENRLPPFNDDIGNVSLLTEGLLAPIVLDELNYSEDWHHVLLDDVEGVSLERISSSVSSDSPESWHSAAETAGFATPTAMNSQQSNNTGNNNELITLENETFSPDNDGYKDFLIINIETGAPDYLANIKVLDAQGRIIKNLSRNTSLASSDLIQWEGDNDEGAKAKIGVYIIWIELFNPNGDVEYIKKRCVLAAKLD